VPGPQGQPGPPGGGLDDIGLLKGLSWQPTDVVPRGVAIDLLGSLQLDFDRDLDPEPVGQRTGQVTVVCFHPADRAGTVLSIGATTKVSANSVVVGCDRSDVGLALERFANGTFVIDVNCDFVLDAQRRLPVSSCSSTLIDTHLPRPGGILRTWLVTGG
jgi:hypothetical protein